MKFSEIALTWKDSIKFLAWKESKLLALVSLNNFRRALKLTAKYFWWLWALWLTFLVLPTFFHVISQFMPHQIFDTIIADKIPSAISAHRLLEVPWTFVIFSGIVFIYNIIDAIIYFTYFLSTRASVEAKSFSYYLAFMPKILFFWITLLLVAFCLAPLAFFPQLFTSNPNILSIAATIIATLFSALPAFVGYAFLDHEKNTGKHGFKSELFSYFSLVVLAIKKGLVLFVHFFPLMIAVSILNLVILFILYGISMFLLSITVVPSLVIAIIFSVFFIQSLMISLLFLSCYATLYIKLKHAYPNLFFA